MAKHTILGGPFEGDYRPITEETTGKAADLMREFGINPAGPVITRWATLAQALAEAYHPSYKKPVGRPKHWKVPDYAILLGTVEFAKEQQNLKSNRAALKFAYEHYPDMLVSSHRKNQLPSFETLYTYWKTANSMKRSGKIW